MAIIFPSSGSGWILSLKVLLTSATVLLMAELMKTVVPVVTDFVVTEVPSVYDFLLSWLRPPYLYLLLNFIIVSIVASSKFQHKVEEAEAPLVYPATAPPPVEPVKVSGDVRMEYAPYSAVNAPAAWSGAVYDERSGKVSVSDPEDVLGGGAEAEASASDTEAKKVNDDDEVVEVLRPVAVPESNDSTDFSFMNLNEKAEEKKPPASARFPARKSLKSSPEAGKALGVSKPKRQDTLESTWKAITDGRTMPLTRHLRKSDTWDARPRRNDENAPPPPPQPRMKKSETFSDRSGVADNSSSPSLSRSPGSGKLRREPSLSQDELNRRVEAFIKKFNEEMRLQRQESLNQYQEMIRRGAA
ncbi:uncharacterized protein LOC116212884 [Punica granatum]|uniref:DUF4408 domain-containing protein n=2 Tax=Punica granatum TaxID=22663 RepID=A0A218XWM2_PUNGR|nr:uncharacterized protein LOC116212884 [Punica granatum]OWM88682.1 hypothetical protein CDL15_Pgr002449 [Punica granatum]PKI65635.1 hypothetical protein CRG98_013930 [Punica granatum]